MQSCVVKECQQTREHPQILSKLDYCLEIPYYVEARDTYGHTYRVLYLAISPDGQTIVTRAGDETLRFWNVFPSPKSQVAAEVTKFKKERL
ncbi:protein FIZZY-RELATED 3-like isoform X2 [Helianthus annuus]|uniref:protein FIZZY-RELATED 3-like isoform X2 n=1 Tax=Helianthus annuus TaxID=4232 RepID=UPI001652FBAD|nr:protein FIZZY-RELATED 3-like isoform X2 [Helianthus annuus]